MSSAELGRIGDPTLRAGQRVSVFGQLTTPMGSLVVALVALFLWKLASLFLFVVAPPEAAAAVLLGGFVQGWVWPHAWATFSAALFGLGLAILLGVGWGILLGVSPFWRSVWEPLLLSAYGIPKIILFPIFLLFFGIGFTAAAAMAFVHALFPLLIITTTAVREINPTYLKVGRSFNVGRLDFLLKIFLPATALPLVVAVRLGFSMAIIGVIMAELYASREGLGHLLMQSYSALNISRMYAVILLLFLIAFVGNVLLWLLEKRLRDVMQ